MRLLLIAPLVYSSLNKETTYIYYNEYKSYLRYDTCKDNRDVNVLIKVFYCCVETKC